MEDNKEKEKYNKGCKHPTEKPHSCPILEMKGDWSPTCNCCEECEDICESYI